MISNVGLARRLLAILYDSLLVLGLVFVLSIPVVILQGGEAVAPDTWWYRLYLGVIGIGYFAGFWLKGGQTLGMKSWQIQVVDEKGGSLSPRQALVRGLAAVVSWLALGAGFLWILIDRRGLAWHDHLSGTRLVRRRYRRDSADAH